MKPRRAFVPVRRWARYGCGLLLAALPALGSPPSPGGLLYLEPVHDGRLLVRGEAGGRLASA